MERKVSTFLEQPELVMIQELAKTEHRSVARQIQCLVKKALLSLESANFIKGQEKPTSTNN